MSNALIQYCRQHEPPPPKLKNLVLTALLYVKSHRRVFSKRFHFTGREGQKKKVQHNDWAPTAVLALKLQKMPEGLARHYCHHLKSCKIGGITFHSTLLHFILSLGYCPKYARTGNKLHWRLRGPKNCP
jgi:hypothetical protein